jgi:hypothetical protein
MKTRHRALIDGLHGAQFGEKFQHSLDARTPNLNSDVSVSQRPLQEIYPLVGGHQRVVSLSIFNFTTSLVRADRLS